MQYQTVRGISLINQHLYHATMYQGVPERGDCCPVSCANNRAVNILRILSTMTPLGQIQPLGSDNVRIYPLILPKRVGNANVDNIYKHL